MKRKDSRYPLVSIASSAGVSTATVSRTINRPDLVKEETRKKVLSAINELGINPDVLQTARQSPDRQPVILLIDQNFNDNLAAKEVHKGILEVAQRNHYVCMMIVADMIRSLPPSMINQMIAQANIVGVITVVRLESNILSLLSACVPVVQVGDVNTAYETCIVMPDFYKGACEIVNHLVSQSCSSIAAVLFDPRISDSSAAKKRAYCDTLHRAGFSVETENLVELPKVDYLIACNAVTSLLKRNPGIDGIFCGTDIYAAAALNICQQNDRSVPDDIKIAGFDDTVYSAITVPKLTTTRHDRFYSGYMGCEMLLERIQNSGLAPERILLENELIVRGSTMRYY